MSKTMVMGPIVAALVKSEDIFEKVGEWNPDNDTQVRFLEEFFSKRSELKGFSEKELRSWASFMVEELNEILVKEGFDIRLDDFLRGEFGIVSILDVLVEWLTKGTKTTLRIKGINYPAVIMDCTDDGVSLFGAYTSSQHPYPIAMLFTKSGDRVYMTIADKSYQDFDLISRIDAIRSDLKLGSRCAYLEFPMINLNHKVDIEWLLDLWAVDADSSQVVCVSQALQQTKFKMNETGARVKSAVALGVRFIASLPPLQPLIIDRPFFLWIERDGMSVPIIYAYLDEEDWKDPGNLDM